MGEDYHWLFVKNPCDRLTQVGVQSFIGKSCGTCDNPREIILTKGIDIPIH